MDRSAVRDISRGSVFLGLEQVTQIIFGTLYSMAILRLLGPSSYGILTLGLAVAGLAGIITMNLETYLDRFVAELHAAGRAHVLRRLIGKVLAVKGSAALVASLAVVALSGTLASAYDKPLLAGILPAVAWMALLEAAFVTFRSLLFGLQHFRLIWILALITNIAKMIMVGVVAVLGGGLNELAWGLIIVVAATTLLGGALVWRILHSFQGPAEDRPPTFRQIWNYVLPLLGARSFYLGGQHLNKVILGALLGATELGYISFALIATERFVAMANALSLSLLPSMSRLKGLKDHAGIERILNTGFRIVSTVAVILSVSVLAFSREIIIILGGFEFMRALPALQVLSLVYLFRTVGQPLTMTFYTFEKTKVVFWLAGLKLFAELALYPVLIPWLGFTGVAVAVVMSSVVIFGPALATVGKIFPETVKVRRGVVLRIWSMAVVLVGAVVAAQHFVPRFTDSVWPSLIVRLNIVLLGLPLAIILARLIRSGDFGRLREQINAPVPQRILSGMQAVLERAEGALGG